jgi:hypothetical protein
MSNVIRISDYTETEVYFYVCQTCFWESESFTYEGDLVCHKCEDCGCDDLRVESEYV